MPLTQKKRKSAATQFVSVAVTSLAIALVITGLLLHASMQKNAESLARIDSLRRSSVIRQHEVHSQPEPSVEPELPQQPVPPSIPEVQSEPQLPKEITNDDDDEILEGGDCDDCDKDDDRLYAERV